MLRLHTDTLTKSDLERAAPSGVDVNVVCHGSRQRDHAFEVALRGYGARHNRRVNSGQRGAGDEYAATYSDWGHWLACLFRKDPKMIAGQYDGVADFHRQTEGLYRTSNFTAALADEVRSLACLPAVPKLEAVKAVAKRHNINYWLLKRAIEGE